MGGLVMAYPVGSKSTAVTVFGKDVVTTPYVPPPLIAETGSKVNYTDLVINPKFRNYTKHALLKALCMYHKNHRDSYRLTKMRNLYEARRRFGTQFLIDLFVFTEIYIKHWPTVDIPECREDLIKVLNNVPDFRILYEEGKIKF